MMEDNFVRNLKMFSVIWAFGAIVSYGHIERQLEADCLERDSKFCMARMDAAMGAFFWPYHWSEVIWKHA